MKDEMKVQIKPKSSASLERAEELNNQTQDRITEKMSYSVPMAKLPQSPDPGLSGYVGKRVYLQLRDGSVLIGDMNTPQWDFLRLSDIEEIGKDYRLMAAWGAVRDDTVARVYPGNAKVEKLANSDA